MTLSLAYVAGLVDGEGYISVTKGKNGAWFPRVGVVNTNFDILVMLQEQFGGSIQSKKTFNPRWKQSHQWRLQHSKAAKFVKRIYPYLQIKYDQATCILLWDAVRPGLSGRWDQDSLKLLRDQLTWLNDRGATAQSTPEPMVVALKRKG